MPLDLSQLKRGVPSFSELRKMAEQNVISPKTPVDKFTPDSMAQMEQPKPEEMGAKAIKLDKYPLVLNKQAYVLPKKETRR